MAVCFCKPARWKPSEGVDGLLCDECDNEIPLQEASRALLAWQEYFEKNSAMLGKTFMGLDASEEARRVDTLMRALGLRKS